MTNRQSIPIQVHEPAPHKWIFLNYVFYHSIDSLNTTVLAESSLDFFLRCFTIVLSHIIFLLQMAKSGVCISKTNKVPSKYYLLYLYRIHSV